MIELNQVTRMKQLIALLMLERDRKKALLIELESCESFSEFRALRVFELEKEVEILQLQIDTLGKNACLN